MPTARVIQLRQLLKEKMPELRLGVDELPAQRSLHWSTGVPQVDEPLDGGLPKGGLTEIVALQRGSGSALLLHALLHQAAREHQIIALIDGADSFDVTRVEEGILSRLLWVRCHSADEALRAADLLSRDQNLPLLLLDLVANPMKSLRRIPATTWFRFQRIIEPTSTVCAVLTPQAMVGPAQVRITLQPSRFSVQTFERQPAELLRELKLEISDSRRQRQSSERLRHIA